MGYDLRFVDQVSASPTVRLDLMAAPWGVQDSTDFGLPELRRSAVSTLLVDGDRYPAAAYGNRLIALVARVVGVDEDATAAALQALYRELDRPTNILMYRPGTSQPVFFRTFRCGPDSVTWDPFTKEVRAVIPAEPFALGLRETLPMVTVNNDPAAGSNGCFFDVASPKGDVEAPLYLRVPALDVSRTPESPATGRRQSVIAVRRRGTPSAMPAVLQAESMTADTDTSVQPASGSSGTFLRTTFATSTTLVARAKSSLFPASPSVDARGQYRVFLRCRKSDGAATMQVQLRYVAGDSYVLSDLSAGPAGTVWRWVDMGLLQLPLGYDPEFDGLSGTPLSVGGMVVTCLAARASGSGNLDLDAIMLLPADQTARMCVVQWPGSTTTTAYIVDSTAGEVYAVGASGQVVPELSDLIGGPPMISPGVTNRIWMLRDVGSTWSTGDDVAASMQVTPYYWPCYLHVRPVAS